MKPTDVIKYLHHYKGCPFRYEYSYIENGQSFTEIVHAKMNYVYDDMIASFEGTYTINGGEELDVDVLEILFSEITNLKLKLILTHPLQVTDEQLKVIRSLKSNIALQTVYCFEQFIDIFGFIDAEIAINAFPNRRKSSHAINTPAILLNEQWKAKRKQYHLNAKNKIK